MLNADSPIPLYHQLADIILDRIRSDEYPARSRIPSENSLAETFRIGRPTARQATDLLVRKGFLKRKRGSGTFVLPKHEEVDLFSLAGTISSFHEKGINVSTKILKKQRIINVRHDSENPFSGKKAFYFSRLSEVNKTPVLIEDMYLHPEIFTGIDQINISNQSLSRIVHERYYLKPKKGNQNFRIGYLVGEKADALSVKPSTPVLVVKRFLHFTQKKNAIFSELYCRTDQFIFSQEIGGMQNG